VRAEATVPIEKRIGIGGVFLDDVRIAQARNAFLGYPVERHRCVTHDDGSATVTTMMPTALQLFATGVLPRLHGAAIEIVVEGRSRGPMVLVEVRCGGEHHGQDVAVLVFEPEATRSKEKSAGSGGTPPSAEDMDRSREGS
jgi:hypothetical protein